MADGTDEQDLVKALDNVASAAAGIGSTPTSGSYGTPDSTAQPVAGAVPSPFPPITQLPTPLPSRPSETPSTFTIPDPLNLAPAAEPQPEPADETPVTAPTDSTMPGFEPAIPAPSDSSTPSEDTGPLASIKQDALVELRPLVDKLTLSPEEKFDTYLLLIRSTDDTELIGPAHEAAKAITDETRRAEALLDIIKEIDYLSHPKTDA